MSKAKAIKKARVFVPITKIDEATQTVYGRITQEVEDKAGETLDYETSAPLFKAWSEGIEKASGGKSYGNVRVMHQLKAAGKLTEIIFLDDDKAIDVAAKIVDADEWEKCLEGVYTGFSIGGGLVKRWKDADGALKITVNPSEVSIVDNPCVPTANFTMMKADGSEEEVSFKIYQPSNEEVAARATLIAKAAGDEALWTDHIEEARNALIGDAVAKAMGEEGDEEPTPEPTEEASPAEPAEPVEGEAAPTEEAPAETGEPAADETTAEKTTPAGVRQVWADSTGKTHDTKKAAVAAELALTTPADPVEAALKAARGDVEEAPETEATEGGFMVEGIADVLTAYKTVKTLFDDKVVQKGLYDLRNFSGILESLSWLADNSICEAGWERDGSKIPEVLVGHLRDLGATFVEMAKEEIAEMVAGLQSQGVRVQIFEGAEGSFKAQVEEEVAKAEGEDPETVLSVPAEIVEKVGARNSKADAARIQKAHDATVEAGAACACGEEETAAKAAGEPTRQELVAKLAERDGQVEKAVAGINTLGEELKTLRAQVAKFADLPQGGAPRFAVIGKGQEGGGGAALDQTGTPKEQLAKLIDAVGPDDAVDLLIKATQNRPIAVGS